MKNHLYSVLHNSSEVFFRNIGTVLWYIFPTALFGWVLFSVGAVSLLTVALFAYNGVRLILGIFGLVIDYLDAAVNVPGLSDFRKKLYDKKILRGRMRRDAVKKEKTILMPYQTASANGMPQVMNYLHMDGNDCGRGSLS